MIIEHIPRVALSSLDFESLAAAIRLRGRDDPGQRFAKLGIVGSTEKHRARMMARDFLLDPSWRSFLTMPGLFFTFEHLLLQKRERGRVFTDPKRRPEKTYLTCIEREPEIYRGSLKFMPGLTHGHVKTLDTIPGAKTSLQTPFIFRYHQTIFEDYAGSGIRFDGAFLDFNGPLTDKRCKAVARFWEISQPKVLILNSMNGRYQSEWNESVANRAICGALGAVPHETMRYDHFIQRAFIR